MSQVTGVDWADSTFNPWWGCVKVSPECDNCYAEREAERYGRRGLWGPDSVRWEMGDRYWTQPVKWNAAVKPGADRHRVFCGSHCDVLEVGNRLQHIRETRLYPLIQQTPNLQWLLTTKRSDGLKHVPALENVMGIVTCGLPSSTWRVERLCRSGLLWRGVSAEPLLGPVDLRPWLSQLHWVIAGGESGGGARPAQLAWALSLRDQCSEFGVPFFWKQWGAWKNGLIQVAKKEAGYELDGRTYREIPQFRSAA